MLKQSGENDRKKRSVGIQHAKTKWRKRQNKKEEEKKKKKMDGWVYTTC